MSVVPVICIFCQVKYTWLIRGKNALHFTLITFSATVKRKRQTILDQQGKNGQLATSHGLEPSIFDIISKYSFK